MKKYYKYDLTTWEWDTDILKWTDLGKQIPPEEPIKKHDLITDANNWSELLFGLFKAYRNFPDWKNVRDLYEDLEDQAYFNMLEKHFKEGKIEAAPYLAEVKHEK